MTFVPLHIPQSVVALPTSEMLDFLPKMLHAETPSERHFEASTGEELHADEFMPSVMFEHHLLIWQHMCIPATGVTAYYCRRISSKVGSG